MVTNRKQYIHAMGYYAAISTNELQTCADKEQLTKHICVKGKVYASAVSFCLHKVEYCRVCVHIHF